MGNHIVFEGETETKICQKLEYFFSLFSLFWGKEKKGFKVRDDFEEELGGGGRADLRPNWAADFKALAARFGMRHGVKKLDFYLGLRFGVKSRVRLNLKFQIQCFLNLPF